MRICVCVWVCVSVCISMSMRMIAATRQHFKASNGMFSMETDCGLFWLINTINSSLCTLVWGSNKDKHLSMHAKPKGARKRAKRKRTKRNRNRNETEYWIQNLKNKNQKAKSNLGSCEANQSRLHLILFSIFWGLRAEFSFQNTKISFESRYVFI